MLIGYLLHSQTCVSKCCVLILVKSLNSVSMQSTLDKFFHKVNSIEETIPKAWLEPIPRSPTPVKRPVGRPRKRRDEVLEFEAELIVADEDTRSPRTPGTPSKRGKYTSYTPKQKALIIDEAELIGLRAAARNWCVAPSTMATWKDTPTSRLRGTRMGAKLDRVVS